MTVYYQPQKGSGVSEDKNEKVMLQQLPQKGSGVGEDDDDDVVELHVLGCQLTY